MGEQRLSHIREFYGLMSELETRLGGARTLSECSGRDGWPLKGVYFFMEPGEERGGSGSGRRIVRVGTHALTRTSKTKLWNRLSQHRGSAGSGGGNHRGSIFRLIVGTALLHRDGLECATWGRASSAPREVTMTEVPIEQRVSQYICSMPFVWLPVDDEPDAANPRGYIERNSIALLSNFRKSPIDPPSVGWLGHACDRERVRFSGLWNNNHVDETYDPSFLRKLEALISATGRRG